MFNVGAGEIAVILLLALIVLGPDKLPSAARQAGKYLSEFRRISDGFQRELRDAMDLDDLKPKSGTMTSAPTKAADVADPIDVEPVGESHRIIETANGPTLPPVMTPTTTPDPTSTATVDPTPAPTGTEPTGTTATSGTTAAAVEVDGPTASFD